ncbi:short-chain dehydrogenase/reductase SDR [Sistotremastrum niveocremeum HHB9708]|uniref:Short-chain dehydrogenase/reductase SDR n=1 Tax=Sistotremastrum niveocremeum HHB9708 TaxID=1314777 RepID=A0A164P3A0_9AGAM|nr:short-chain dehydrogenase/reductase SDR [Sistotremastrum niveocremeum HHB9708]
MSDLNGQTVVVIGGSSGIGFAVATQSLRSHASLVIIASSSAQKVDNAVNGIQAFIQQSGLIAYVTGKVLNMKDSNQIRAFFSEIGQLDHLVITSGDPPILGPFKTLDLDQARGSFDTRFWGAAVAAQSAQIKKGGSIVLTVGTVIKKPEPGWALVTGQAGATDSLTRGLSVDLVKRSMLRYSTLAPIRVNIIAPGYVSLWDTVPQDAREKMLQEAADKLLVKHVVSADEMLVLCIRCGFITGETLHVNGGQTLI